MSNSTDGVYGSEPRKYSRWVLKTNPKLRHCMRLEPAVHHMAKNHGQRRKEVTAAVTSSHLDMKWPILAYEIMVILQRPSQSAVPLSALATLLIPTESSSRPGGELDTHAWVKSLDYRVMQPLYALGSSPLQKQPLNHKQTVIIASSSIFVCHPPTLSLHCSPLQPPPPSLAITVCVCGPRKHTHPCTITPNGGVGRVQIKSCPVCLCVSVIHECHHPLFLCVFMPWTEFWLSE